MGPFETSDRCKVDCLLAHLPQKLSSVVAVARGNGTRSVNSMKLGYQRLPEVKPSSVCCLISKRSLRVLDVKSQLLVFVRAKPRSMLEPFYTNSFAGSSVYSTWNRLLTLYGLNSQFVSGINLCKPLFITLNIFENP